VHPVHTTVIDRKKIETKAQTGANRKPQEKRKEDSNNRDRTPDAKSRDSSYKSRKSN